MKGKGRNLACYLYLTNCKAAERISVLFRGKLSWHVGAFGRSAEGRLLT